MTEPADAPPRCVADWAASLVQTLEAESDSALVDLHLLRQQLTALQQQAPVAPVVDPTVPQIVRQPAALPAIAATLAQAPAVAIDLETSSLDPRRGEIVGIGLAVAAGVYYFPTAHYSGPNGKPLVDQLTPTEVVQALRLAALPLVAHNAKFELHWLQRHTGIRPRFVWDTMLAAHLLRSDLPVGLKDVVRRELDVPDWSLSAADLRRVACLPVERVARYCAKDVSYTLELMRRQQARLVSTVS